MFISQEHDDVGMFSDWYVVSVTVQKEGEENRHKFFVNSWVVGTVHVVEEGRWIIQMLIIYILLLLRQQLMKDQFPYTINAVVKTSKNHLSRV